MFITISNVFSKIVEKCDISGEKLRKLVWISPEDLCFRICLSFIPPVTTRFKKIHVDLLGPSFAIALLILILNYSQVYINVTEPQISSTGFIVLYLVAMPMLCFLLSKMGHSWLSFLETFILIGYALYGYVLTLIFSLLFYSEDSNANFFINLIIFGGLSTFRMALLQMQSIPLPGARLLICTIISVAHILFLIFLHFTYMHASFVYGKKSSNFIDKIQ